MAGAVSRQWHWGTISGADRSHIKGQGEFLGDKETEASGKHNHELFENGEHIHEMEQSEGHSHILSGGDKETRPKNVAVKCLIRYRSTDLQVAQLEDKVSVLSDTMQNQYQNLQFMSFFASTATTVGVAVGAARLFRR